MFVREFLESKLGIDGANEFALWAFGLGFKECTRDQYPHRWNSLHSKDFILHPNGNVEKDLLKMIELWEKQK